MSQAKFLKHLCDFNQHFKPTARRPVSLCYATQVSNNLAIDHQQKPSHRSEQNQQTLQEYRQKIQRVYDQTVKRYNQSRDELRTQRYLTRFMQYLPKQAHVLDLGCGAGIPIDDVLIKRGYLVTGLDFSAQQLVLARHNCPRAAYQQLDLAELTNDQFSADGIVCLYTIFHLPRVQHAQWLKTISTYLPKNAPLLISMGDQPFEGWHEFHDQEIWSSHFGPTENRTMLKDAGFTIELDEIDRSGRENHHLLIALKATD